jgi:hypothetical protein
MKTNVLGSDLIYDGSDNDRKSKVDGLLCIKKQEFHNEFGLESISCSGDVQSIQNPFIELVNCTYENGVLSYTSGNLPDQNDNWFDGQGFSARLNPEAKVIRITISENDINGASIIGSITNDYQLNSTNDLRLSLNSSGASCNGGTRGINFTNLNDEYFLSEVGDVIEFDLYNRTVRNITKNSKYGSSYNDQLQSDSIYYPQPANYPGIPPYLNIVRFLGDNQSVLPVEITVTSLEVQSINPQYIPSLDYGADQK